MVEYFNRQYVNMIYISDARETTGAEDQDWEERTTTRQIHCPIFLRMH